MHFVPLHGSLAQLYRYQVCNSTGTQIIDSGKEVRTKLVNVFLAADLSLVSDSESKYACQYCIVCIGGA